MPKVPIKVRWSFKEDRNDRRRKKPPEIISFSFLFPIAWKKFPPHVPLYHHAGYMFGWGLGEKWGGRVGPGGRSSPFFYLIFLSSFILRQLSSPISFFLGQLHNWTLHFSPSIPLPLCFFCFNFCPYRLSLWAGTFFLFYFEFHLKFSVSFNSFFTPHEHNMDRLSFTHVMTFSSSSLSFHSKRMRKEKMFFS